MSNEKEKIEIGFASPEGPYIFTFKDRAQKERYDAFAKDNESKFSNLIEMTEVKL